MSNCFLTGRVKNVVWLYKSFIISYQLNIIKMLIGQPADILYKKLKIEKVCGKLKYLK